MAEQEGAARVQAPAYSAVKSRAAKVTASVPAARPKPPRAARQRKQSASAAALADAVATGTFVLLSSTFGQVADVLSRVLQVPNIAAQLGVIVAGVLLHTPLCYALGQPLYNPAHNFAFYAAGLGSPKQHVLRASAQIAGAVGGSVLALALVPAAWQSGFEAFGRGVRPGVPLWAGMLTETLLVFLLNLVVLWSMGLKNKYVAFWMPLLATLGMIVAGAELTGPSMNPAMSFGWYVHFQGHSVYEHAMVYWVSPIVGSIAAGLLWWHIREKPRKLKAD